MLIIGNLVFKDKTLLFNKVFAGMTEFFGCINKLAAIIKNHINYK